MRMNTLADALPDFGSRRPEPPIVLKAPPPQAAEPAAPAPLPEFRQPPQPDVTAIVAAEVVKAEIALRERLEQEHAIALERERAAHRSAIAVLQASQGEDLGRLIAERLDPVADRITDVTVEAVSRILALVTTDVVRARMLEAMADSLRKALTDDGLLRIRVSGPQTLYEPLAAALGPLARRLDYRATEALDLTIELAERLVETRLAEWQEALGQVLS